MPAVIDIVGLHKHFGHVRALDGLDLQVNEGKIHGFLGPNGAGKTTTIRILLGVLRARSGKATLLGRDPWRDAVALHPEIAYVPAMSRCGHRSPAVRRSACWPACGVG